MVLPETGHQSCPGAQLLSAELQHVPQLAQPVCSPAESENLQAELEYTPGELAHQLAVSEYFPADCLTVQAAVLCHGVEPECRLAGSEY